MEIPQIVALTPVQSMPSFCSKLRSFNRKRQKMNTSLLCFAALSLTIVAAAPTLGADSTKKAQNPILWADVPDIAIIRVGDTYYMSSTTMHMSPGLPIMKSNDLTNWQLVNYAYDTL